MASQPRGVKSSTGGTDAAILPITSVDPAPETCSQSPVSENQSSSAPVILVVDDEQGVREIFAEALRLSGYTTHEAADGSAALKILNSQAVDLLMTDILMPDVDGLELIMAARRAHPDLKVIAMSGGGRTAAEVLINIARRLGVQRTLEKPFELSQLLAEVKALVGDPVPQA